MASCCWATEGLASYAAVASSLSNGRAGDSSRKSPRHWSGIRGGNPQSNRKLESLHCASSAFHRGKFVELLRTPSSSASSSCSSSSSSSSKELPVCRASLAKDLAAAARVAATGAAAFGLSVLLELSPVAPAIANEGSILNTRPPKDTYVVDDASVLNRVTKSELKNILGELEYEAGFHIDFITLRKITGKSDAFEFADQVLEKWYPTIEEGNNKGLVLLITTQKEGAVTGGPGFIKAVGDSVLEGIVAENLPVLSTDEKYNEAFSSTAKRLINAIKGQPDLGGPKFQEVKRESNFKSKEETNEKRGQFQTVVGGLLVIAFVVPMAQYYAYVSKK